MYDVIIVGGGPAGAAAAIYAARKKMKTLVITENFGGQSVVSDSIENWIGDKKITGLELAKRLESHVKAQEGAEIKTPAKAMKVEKIESGFGANGASVPAWKVFTDQGDSYEALTLIVVSGGRRRRLSVPGEAKFEGKGISYCATCDAPIFKNKIVAIIGGGNAGLEAAIDLTRYAEKVYLVSNKPSLTGDPANLEVLMKSGKAEIINNANVSEILGDQFVSGIRYLDKSGDNAKELKVDGIFVEIGSIPNSEFIKDLVETDERNRIVVDHRTGATSRPGIFAAGDVTDALYNQNNISAGDAIKASLSAYYYLLNIKKQNK